jgi:hypothetical protein
LAKDAERLFSLSFCTSFENCLFSSLTHLFNGLLMLYKVNFF